MWKIVLFFVFIYLPVHGTVSSVLMNLFIVCIFSFTSVCIILLIYKILFITFLDF